MAVAAFWIALAAVLVAGSWKRKNLEQMRHETLRALIEKGGDVDPQTMKDLLHPPQAPQPAGHAWHRQQPGDGRRVARILGTILMIIGPGVGALVASVGVARALGFTTSIAPGDATVVIALGIGLAIVLELLGVALLVASRHMLPPVPAVADGR
jgi:hypothetical protein